VALVLDAGPIYSSIDRSDRDHAAVVEVLRTTPRPHFVVESVLVEVDYWLRKLLDVSALQAFVSDIQAGRYALVPLDVEDVVRTVEIESMYADSEIGFVDASLVAVCERLDVGAVLTFDRRHLTMVRPRHRRTLELLP
jgi:predicted nucleic acid-binding protein